ncbi:MobH family relaxase [Vibrio hyugaensis]|uniref:MobH family relaxase n=1 Tax=Vibrio hyugaensis TaxID=1534743 RepID=UPI0005F0AEE8|nr:MobH family relaxase [Vibrio hyugaensis]
MFQSLQRFVAWLYDEPHIVSSSPSVARGATEDFVLPATRAELENDALILDKLRVLKRSGLALPFEVWQEFVVDTVINYALWCQDLPASQSYHHTGKRGLLLHSLDVAIYAMRLRRNAILPPNTPPEDVIHREIVWVYGVFLCALLHDSGKIMDVDIELHQGEGGIVRWTPLMGPITLPYRAKYHPARQYSTHQYTGHTLLSQLLGADAMLAISSDKALYHTMMESLSGHNNPDNVIEQIVTQADAASVAQDLGADKAGINLAAEKARGATLTLAGQLKLTLSHLLQSGALPLNKKGAEGFVEGEWLYLMSKPIAERLRTALLERGITSVPSDNSRLFNELQQHQLIRPNADDMAIWKCEVLLSEFDWRQTFTFVCVHWPTFAPEANFDSLIGHILPLQEGESAQSESTTEPQITTNLAGSSTDEPIPEEQSDSLPSAETLPPASPISDDLMAFMAPLAAPVTETVEEAADATLLDEKSTPSSDAVDTALEALSQAPASSDSAMTTEDEEVPHILLQQIDLRETRGEALGMAFYDWVDAVLKGGVHPVNRQGALFHRVEQGLFVVSPGAFRTFISERCQYGKPNSYSEVQQGLQPLGRHIVAASGRNVHKARIKDSSQSLNGFLFPLTPEWETRYALNPHVMLEDI